MGWFRSLNLTNKLLLAGIVSFMGFMVFAANDFSVFSANVGYEPIKEVDKVDVSIYLSRAFVQSDGISGDSAVDSNTGASNSVFREFSVEGELAVSTPLGDGRRSYASIERKCVASPWLYSEGTTCEQVPLADIQENPYAICYGTAQECMVYYMRTDGFGYPTNTVAGSSEPSDQSAENLIFAVTNYNAGSEVEVPISGSDEFSPQKYMGTYTAREESNAGWQLLTNTSYGGLYTEGVIPDSERTAFVEPSVPTPGTGACLPSDSIFTCIGKSLGVKVGDLTHDVGAVESFENSNFSMTVMTKDISDFDYSYELGLNYLQLVHEIYGDGDIYQNCVDLAAKVPPETCSEASVAESFSLWAEGSAYPFAEKNVYMQDYFMGIFDTTGIPRNYISAPFVESYDVTGQVSVAGHGTYGSGNSIEGKLFEVASRAPAKMQEDNVQLASALSPDTVNYSKVPGYTCEFRGKTTNGWIGYNSDINVTSNPPVTIVGSNIGAVGDIADDLSIKVGREKAITKDILVNGGYTVQVDGNPVSLANAINSSDTGIVKYRDTGPTLFSYAGSTYVGFTMTIAENQSEGTRYGGFLAEVSSGGTLVRLTQFSDRASHTRAINITSAASGNLLIMYQSGDGRCGGGDPMPACLYVVEYDINNGTLSTPMLMNNSSSASGYFSALAVDSYYEGAITGFAGDLPVLPGTSEFSGLPIAVFQSGGAREKKLYVSSGGSIIQFPDVLASDGVAEPFSFKIDSNGQRHLVIKEKTVMYHARWNDETGGTLNGYSVEALPLPLATKGASVKLGDIDFINGALVVMYTVYPKEDNGSSAVVFLVSDTSSDYWIVQPDGSNTEVSGSVYRAYVIDENAIVDWTADNIKRPFLEGKTLSTKNGRIDAALGFGMFGWTIFVEDVTGYSATSRIWDQVYGSEYSYAYTTVGMSTGYSNNPQVVKSKDITYSLGQEVTANLSSAYPSTSDSETMSAGELMTLIKSTDLASGVEVVPNKLPWLAYVDNVWEMNVSKALCWKKLKQYTPMSAPTISPYPLEEWTLPETPDEPVVPTPEPVSGGTCTESWCFTGDIYGNAVTYMTEAKLEKMAVVLATQRGKSLPEETERNEVAFLCRIATEHNVSCPFMFAIWLQESSLRDTPNSGSDRHLEFGCLLSEGGVPIPWSRYESEPCFVGADGQSKCPDDYYYSWETQVICSAGHALNLRGEEWTGAVDQGATSLAISGSVTCNATTEFSYIMEKYTPTETTPGDGNSPERENLRSMLEYLSRPDIGILPSNVVFTSAAVCKQI